MNKKVLYHAFGLMALLISIVTYMMTVQPSVPFWDCGEFSAAAIWQQVPHPPGSPLFLMVGNLFHTLIPFGDPGWRVNLTSVFASAFTIWLLYFITVMAINNLRGSKPQNLAEEISVYGAAFVGALAFNFSDTFWFNGVESEVYASSTFFVALVVYLMLRWNEEADNPGHERYLLLMAYFIGLSSGVHLLAILTLFSIVVIVYFRKYEFNWKTFILTGIIGCLIFFVIYPGIIKWVPAVMAGHFPFKNKCREYIIDSPAVTFLGILFVIAAITGLWYGVKRNKSLLNLVCGSFLLVLLGYTTYTQVLIRSNSNSPLNENEPKNFGALTDYLGREQYGEAPNWPRRYQHDDTYYTDRYSEKDEKGNYLYGEWFPPERVEAVCKDGQSRTYPEFKTTNTSGEINYLMKYQIGHMFMRYFYWNFVGRKSDVQDADEAWFSDAGVDKLNFESGYAKQFPIRFYAIPLLFGLIGLIFHFYRHPKTAFSFFIMFLLMGVLAAIAQNQQNPQPRERDYFYAGAFLVYAMWIGIGAYALIDWLCKKNFTAKIAAPVVALSILIVPVNMGVGGWKIHSRAGNYIPFDYSYNILQSTEKDAIIFTNGDNDTFPLWFLQDVEGVRRDVRVVNLSLANTLWYVDQLKNREPWGAKKLPLSFADDSIQCSETDPQALTYEFAEPYDVAVPVDREILQKYTSDPAVLADGNFRFKFSAKPFQEYKGKMLHLYMIRDKLILDILRQTKFKRPVYYSITVGPDAYCGLENYFRYEGMAMRICPVPQKKNSMEPIDPVIMEKCLISGVDNSNNFHTEPHYGFKFRNLNNMGVYYDEVHRRLMRSYRSLFLSYAQNTIYNQKDKAKTAQILDRMNDLISPEQFPLIYEFLQRIAKLYKECGQLEQAKKYALMGIKTCTKLINDPTLMPGMDYYEAVGRYYGPYRTAANLYEMVADYQSARSTLQKLYALSEQTRQSVGTDPEYKTQIEYNLMDLKVNMDELTILETKDKQGNDAALKLANTMLERYQSSSEPSARMFARYIEKRIKELGGLAVGDSGEAITEVEPR